MAAPGAAAAVVAPVREPARSLSYLFSTNHHHDVTDLDWDTVFGQFGDAVAGTTPMVITSLVNQSQRMPLVMALISNSSLGEITFVSMVTRYPTDLAHPAGSLDGHAFGFNGDLERELLPIRLPPNCFDDALTDLPDSADDAAGTL